jgi:hypothetical protein
MAQLLGRSCASWQENSAGELELSLHNETPLLLRVGNVLDGFLDSRFRVGRFNRVSPPGRRRVAGVPAALSGTYASTKDHPPLAPT